jgi:predicted metal-dependent HD superfamily phosphohydrolase
VTPSRPETKPELPRWSLLWLDLGARGNPESVYDLLAERYAEPQRAYHTLTHVAHCLDELEAARHLAAQPNQVEMALWFHDAVYDPKAKDNERSSAELCQQIMEEAGLSGAFGQAVTELILVTQHHEAPDEPDARLLVDIDLAILGQSVEIFDRYEENIRREYHFVPPDRYRLGRSAILRGFLDRPAIFATAFFQQRFESQARANLERSLENL